MNCSVEVNPSGFSPDLFLVFAQLFSVVLVFLSCSLALILLLVRIYHKYSELVLIFEVAFATAI